MAIYTTKYIVDKEAWCWYDGYEFYHHDTFDAWGCKRCLELTFSDRYNYEPVMPKECGKCGFPNKGGDAR